MENRYIKAPFNFVPLANKIYFPKWAKDISHDIPFEDGVSGYITLQFVAESPVFVRNGHRKREAPSESNQWRGEGDYLSASKIGNEYFLPATSVKGMVRNVFEIMTSCKMRLDKRAKFAQREWGNQALYPFVAAKKVNGGDMKAAQRARDEVKCGWLIDRGMDRKEGEERYYIMKCPAFYRINHKRIDKQLLKKDVLRNEFAKRDGVTLADDHKTAWYKYELLRNAGYGQDRLRNLRFIVDEDYACEFQENRVCISDNGDIVGTIVLTGQPDMPSWADNRKMGDGKFYEFVFEEGEDYRIEVDEESFNFYKFIYQCSDEWDFITSRLEGKGVPVFFRDIIVDDKHILKDFGFAYLYKLPYENTPYDLEQKPDRYGDHPLDTPDMADCVFGYVNEKEGTALKGRVQFSHFFCKGMKECNDYRLVLNSPKASYYPIYIRQDGKDGHVVKYKTYNDGVISGWKRYNLRSRVWEKYTGEDKLDTIIYPLGTGSVFEGRVNFHNLKSCELGALLSALSFFGNEKCSHQIGQGKPYGFGRLSWRNMRLNIVEERNFKEGDSSYYMALFEEHMNKNMKYVWNVQESIVHLFSMASNIIPDSEITHYMILQMEDKDNNIKAKNEFQDAKDAKEYLENFVSKYGSTSVNSKKTILDTIREGDEIKRYEEKKNNLICDINDLINKSDCENAEAKLQELRLLLNSHEDYNSPILDELSTKIGKKKMAASSAESVGEQCLKEYVCNEKYISPLANKAIEWYQVKGEPSVDDIEYLKVKVDELRRNLKKGGEKQFEKSMNKLKSIFPELG